jgi:dTDP-4-amino-4,6-dideoxygalactose transaminase
VGDELVGERIPLARPDVGAAELAALREVLADGMLTRGPRVDAFGRAVAAATETSDAVAVSSGTAALHLALLALGVGAGDEVVVPAYTFPATANAVALCGARAVLVDVDADTFLAPAELVSEAVTARTRVVIGVHLFGRPLDWEALRRAVPDRVALLEDAAGALGARHRGVPCGGLPAAAGCLSFHPRKIVTTGEGGAVTTRDTIVAATVRRLRHHGFDGEHDIAVPGLNYRLADVLCALGLPQLARLEELLAARARVAGWYAERLAATDVTLPTADDGDRHGWQAYVVSLDRRDDARAALAAAGIETQIGTYALHRLTAYADQGPFPGAGLAFERALALPLAPTTTEGEVDRVCAALAATR